MNNKYFKIKYQTPPIGKEKIVLYLYDFDIEAYERDLEIKQSQEIKYYTVKIGDTLWDIANKFGTTWENLTKINRIKNPDLIYPTQRIRIK